jgi:hypothetical protein
MGKIADLHVQAAEFLIDDQIFEPLIRLHINSLNPEPWSQNPHWALWGV